MIGVPCSSADPTSLSGSTMATSRPGSPGTTRTDETVSPARVASLPVAITVTGAGSLPRNWRSASRDAGGSANGCSSWIVTSANLGATSPAATSVLYGSGVRVVVQRASTAEVTVDGEMVGRLPRPGLVVLVGVTHDDTAATAAALADKVWRLRILDGERSCADDEAPLLVISQFTLYADTRKGRRPSWSNAAPGPVAEPLVDAFANALRSLGAHVETGRFGAHMLVSLVNDGPVTLVIDS